MVEVTSDSELLFDPRVLASFKSPENYISFWPEGDLADLLPRIAGCTPVNPYFTAPDGNTFRIGWFVGYVDQSSNLHPPFRPSILDKDLDTRVADRSMPGVIDWSDFNLFGGGERLIPFAALYTNDECPGTLLWQDYDNFVDDSVCIDISTSPHSVVYCNAMRAAEAVGRFEDSAGDAPLDYDSFVSPVAPTLSSFLSLLRRDPQS